MFFKVYEETLMCAPVRKSRILEQGAPERRTLELTGECTDSKPTEPPGWHCLLGEDSLPAHLLYSL